MLCNFLETSCEQTLFTVQQLYEQMSLLAGSDDDIYSTTALKLKLEERYGLHVFVVGQPGKLGFAVNVLGDKCYSNRADKQMTR